MPSEFSLYRKIQVILDIAKASDIASWNELSGEIISERPPNFLTKQYDKRRDAMLPDISTRSVTRAVNACRALQLIYDSGSLTDAGRRALRSSLFNRVISEQVHRYLEQFGIRVANLNNIIEKSLRSDPLVMPTSAELWQRSGSRISLLRFSQMLTLLVQCGSADSSQRKIYLHFTR